MGPLVDPLVGRGSLSPVLCVVQLIKEIRAVPGYSRSSSRSSANNSQNENAILGMASHDLSNAKTTILAVTLGAIPGTAANPPESFSFAPAFSSAFFTSWGGPRAPDPP